MGPNQPVVHLVHFPLLGHVMHPRSDKAHDCWCEPSNIFWVRNNWGVDILIVEHNDYSDKHRSLQLAEQAEGIPQQLAWINHALYGTVTYPTAAHRDIQARGFKQLPPHEEKRPDAQ